MTRLRTNHRLIGTIVGLSSLGMPIDSVSAREPPRFEATACRGVPDIADIMPRLRFGTVRVPRNHADPNGPTYALAVVVIRSERQPALPDPVVYISGGPGGPLTVYTGYQAHHSYAADRDLVLIDQRGTGRSEPRLCPDRRVELVTSMLAVVTEPTQAALAADRAVHTACRDEVIADGIDPNGFGTAVTVEDFESVRRALGISRWNVVGESYGTTVAMTLLAHQPESIRSAVLDSLNPPDAFFDMPWSQRVAHARDAFLSACQADPSCNSSTPDLPAAYREAMARLEREAPAIPLPLDLHVPGDRVRLTPSLFEELVGRLVYYPPTHAELPGLITATRDGAFGEVGAALATLLGHAERDGNDGLFVAVECRDRPRWRDPVGPDASPLDLGLIPPGVCAPWAVFRLMASTSSGPAFRRRASLPRPWAR